MDEFAKKLYFAAWRHADALEKPEIHYGEIFISTFK
jgi:hypothetical protein